MPQKQVRKWIGLFLILLFPSLLYVVLSTGKHQIIRLPYYGEKKFVANDEVKRVDTTYYSIPQFSAANHLGEKISLNFISGKTTVFSFVCANCNNSSSDRLNAEFAQLQLQFENRKDLNLISFVVNGTNLDSAQKVNYIKNCSPNDNFWQICFTDNAISKTFAQAGLLIEDYIDNIGSPTFVLVDSKLHIRGYYNGIEYLEVKELIDGIKVLKAEEFIPKKQN